MNDSPQTQVIARERLVRVLVGSSMSESCHTYEWVMSHIWVSQVTHMSEPCQTFESRTSCARKASTCARKKSCHANEWVMSQIWMNHVTNMNESCHKYQWVMPSRLLGVFEGIHVTHMNASWHTQVIARDRLVGVLEGIVRTEVEIHTTHSRVCHGLFCKSLLQTRPYCRRAWRNRAHRGKNSHDSFTCVSWSFL